MLVKRVPLLGTEELLRGKAKEIVRDKNNNPSTQKHPAKTKPNLSILKTVLLRVN